MTVHLSNAHVRHTKSYARHSFVELLLITLCVLHQRMHDKNVNYSVNVRPSDYTNTLKQIECMCIRAASTLRLQTNIAPFIAPFFLFCLLLYPQQDTPIHNASCDVFILPVFLFIRTGFIWLLNLHWLYHQYLLINNNSQLETARSQKSASDRNNFIMKAASSYALHNELLCVGLAGTTHECM